jgi:hypothetical protein
MAWRIHESVIRGEIDNRVKGRVIGRVWIEGFAEPVALDLVGNAHPDLAGCLLKFSNAGEPTRMRSEEGIDLEQTGTVGDLTASRKVRVFDVPVAEAYKMCKRGEKPPEHMANSLYLEWFSEVNGRVVIESVEFELNISAPEWRLTETENEERAKTAREGMSEFMGGLTEAVESAESKVDYDKEEWDEFDYEKFMQESDARTDKYIELLDKYGDSDEGEKIIAQEMNWTSAEEHDLDESTFGLDSDEVPELEPVAETEGVDWIRTDDGDIVHPLQYRCFSNAMKLWDECTDSDTDADEHVSELITGYQIVSAKLAGALNNLAYGCEDDERAFTVACLKRTISLLHKAQESLEHPAIPNRLPAATLSRVRAELFDLRESILGLMDEFRGRAN